MGTVIRPEISEKSKYWIDKHRHYELKHFCLQYPRWKKAYLAASEPIATSSTDRSPSGNIPGEPTGQNATAKVY